MIAKTYTCGLQGVNGYIIEVESYINSGMYQFDIVGLPSAAVKESRDRIRAALSFLGYNFPAGRVVVNLSPADIKKEGTAFELAIAICIMAANNPNKYQIKNTMLLGELTLDGRIMPIRGALPIAITAINNGINSIILPKENARECACLENLQVYPAETLLEVVQHVTNKKLLPLLELEKYVVPEHFISSANDMAYVKGQPMARKALEIAATGGHNMLMMGIPGSGKTMLARCLPGILPPLSYEESLETTLIHSAAGELAYNSPLIKQRPFRSPHHNISMPAMIGGGLKAKPGEVSLAHNGVLFLDEMPEFSRITLEALRQPLEDGFVNVTRIQGQNCYQSNCMLIIGMNPCPCGFYGSKQKKCTCSPNEIKRYAAKISGPLLDRIDIHIPMDAVSIQEIESSSKQEDSLTIQKRVLNARKIQLERYKNEKIFCNAQLNQVLLEKYVKLSSDVKKLLMQAVDRYNISMRTYSRIQKVARSIADLAQHEDITVSDMALAIQMRNGSVQGGYHA